MTRFVAIAIAAAVALTAASSARAQPRECAQGRVRVDGRCCWPAQSWSDARGRCEGPPACPEGRVEHGDDCVLADPAAPIDPSAIPVPFADASTRVPPGTTTASWPLAIGSSTAPERRAVLGRGEDEALITVALAIVDVGWVLGWMGLFFDEAWGCSGPSGHASCQSMWWGFAPLFGGITGSLTNFSSNFRSSLIAFPFGVTSVCLQGIGIIMAIIAFSNETTEMTLQRLDLSDTVTASIVPGAAESDAGLTASLSF